MLASPREEMVGSISVISRLDLGFVLIIGIVSFVSFSLMQSCGPLELTSRCLWVLYIGRVQLLDYSL